MTFDFINRTQELRDLTAAARQGGLLVVFGRRRVGKTRLLVEWLGHHRGFYSQAIEASLPTQLEQVMRDFGPQFAPGIMPKSWADLFELFDLDPKAKVLCLDEFPFLVAADPSLPSALQRFLDHRKRKETTVVLSSSSTRVMHDTVLDYGAPLNGRATKILHLLPLGYGAFCRALGLEPEQGETFHKFAMVGGIPQYWERVAKRESAVQLSERLYFGPAASLEFEPMRLLRDEGVGGLSALAVLEAVGRGAEKPSEIAARLETPLTNLGRLFQQLLDASILERAMPFGENTRSTKRCLYRIADPALRFWFSVYSPHRTRWARHSDDERRRLVVNHASTVFEDCVRAKLHANRHWEKGIALDAVYVKNRSTLGVREVKWARLSVADRASRRTELQQHFARSSLAPRHSKVDFDVVDMGFLAHLA